MLSLFLLASSQTGFSHHLRYVLSVLPFAFVWVSRVVGSMALATHKKRVALAVSCAIWSFLSSLWIFPHSQSYFNELVGGPMGGRNHVVDSNLDWGQDLLYLKSWIDSHPESRPLSVAYFGRLKPSVAGIDAHLPPAGNRSFLIMQNPHPECIGPQPGWFAISVEARQRGWFYHQGDYRYFQQFKPLGFAGYSIYIYHLSIDDANSARRALGLPEIGKHVINTSTGQDIGAA